MAHRPWRHLDTAPAGKFDGDLRALATFHEALESHADENVVGDFGPRSHDARQVRRANEGQFWMSRAVALPFPGDEFSVSSREDSASLRQPHAQWAATLSAAGIGPGKGEARERSEFSLTGAHRLRTFLGEDIEKSYGALFLSRS